MRWETKLTNTGFSKWILEWIFNITSRFNKNMSSNPLKIWAICFFFFTYWCLFRGIFINHQLNKSLTLLMASSLLLQYCFHDEFCYFLPPKTFQSISIFRFYTTQLIHWWNQTKPYRHRYSKHATAFWKTSLHSFQDDGLCLCTANLWQCDICEHSERRQFNKHLQSFFVELVLPDGRHTDQSG